MIEWKEPQDDNMVVTRRLAKPSRSPLASSRSSVLAKNSRMLYNNQLVWRWVEGWMLSSVGRAAPLQGVGREFETLSIHQTSARTSQDIDFARFFVVCIQHSRCFFPKMVTYGWAQRVINVEECLSLDIWLQYCTANSSVDFWFPWNSKSSKKWQSADFSKHFLLLTVFCSCATFHKIVLVMARN